MNVLFSLAKFFMVLLTLAISFFNFWVQNQNLRFLVLVPSWDLYDRYCYTRQDFIEAQSIVCFVLLLIVCFIMLSILVISSEHRPTVFGSKVTPQVNFLGQNSQFFCCVLLLFQASHAEIPQSSVLGSPLSVGSVLRSWIQLVFFRFTS